MKHHFLKIFVFAFLLTGIFICFKVTFADTLSYTPLAPLPGIEDAATASNLSLYLRAIFRLAIGVAAALAVIMIMIGGFEYIFSTVPGVKGDGKEKIQQALLGLLLAIASWVILSTIDPSLTRFDFNIGSAPAVEIPAGPTAAYSKSLQCYGPPGPNNERVVIETFIIDQFNYTPSDQASKEEASSACKTKDPAVHFNTPVSDPRCPSGTLRESVICESFEI